jgi:hypothetical protein
MGSSSTTRAARPAPLDLTQAREFHKRGSISSVDTAVSHDNDDNDVPAHHHITKAGTKASRASWASAKSGASSSSSAATGVKHSPTVNVYTTCGRHTDQFLFGGRSLSDLARAVLGRKPKGGE